MGTHDPQRFIQLLRDHLAAHDKRLLFLLGAGTSCSVNVAPPADPGKRRGFRPLIPAIDALTGACQEAVDALSDEHMAAWQQLEEECGAMGLAPHIENVLGRLRRKVDAAAPGQGALGLGEQGLRDLEETIRATIAELASPVEAAIPDVLPHDSFSTWVRHARRRHPIEIFTTNYDVLIERSLERARVPLFDGFVGSYEPYFSPDGIESDESMPGYEWARLWKLHGSVNWELRAGSVVRVASSTHGEMILPSHRKYDESRKFPYLALIDRLGRCLAIDGALLITCGYSWQDQHINAVVLSALQNHPASHTIALSYSPLDEMPHLVDLAESHENLLVAGPREGIVQRARGQWALPTQVDNATASVLDLAFDSDALPEQDSGRVPGEIRLGDFNALCRFLSAMQPPRGSDGS